MKDFTKIGFKRVMNKRNPLGRGCSRAFVECKEKRCGHLYYYDYVPYSLSNPIMTADCGHDVRRMKNF